jgi:hypothetical protein
MTIALTPSVHDMDVPVKTKTMNSIDSIIFNSDNGPVANLLHKDATQMNKMKGSNNHGQPTRMVRFFDSNVSEEEKRSFSDQSIESDLIQVLKDRLTEVQSDLKTERAIRIRKEKNLIKLAMELNKRTIDAHDGEEKIENMTWRINTMETLLKSSQHEVSQQVLTYKDILCENDLKIAEHNDLILNLRMQLAQASSEINRLRGESRGDKSKPTSNIPKLPTFQTITKRMLTLCFVLSVVCVGSLAMFQKISPVSMHGFCSQAMPGAGISTNSDTSTMVSPWSVHQLFIDQAFDLMCGGKKSVTMHRKNISSQSRSGSSKILISKRPDLWRRILRGHGTH